MTPIPTRPARAVLLGATVLAATACTDREAQRQVQAAAAALAREQAATKLQGEYDAAVTAANWELARVHGAALLAQYPDTEAATVVEPALADITAKAYSLQMLSDLYVRGEAIGAKAKEVLEKKAGPAGGQGPEQCAAVLFAEHADQGLTLMLRRIRSLKEAAKTSYIAAAGEMNTIVTYLNHMQRLESQMAAEITRRYGKDLADRVQAQ